MKYTYLKYSLLVDNHMKGNEEIKITSVYLLSVMSLAWSAVFFTAG